jgi:hypothetical protein
MSFVAKKALQRANLMQGTLTMRTLLVSPTAPLELTHHRHCTQ